MRELLKAGADVARRNNVGSMSLHSACIGGHAEIVRELLAKGADKEAVTNDGNTPLILACEHGHLAAAKLLIVEHGVAINHLDNDGRSALWWAKRRVRRDAAAPSAGPTAVSAEKRAEHAQLIKFLKFLKSRGAT